MPSETGDENDTAMFEALISLLAGAWKLVCADAPEERGIEPAKTHSTTAVCASSGSYSTVRPTDVIMSLLAFIFARSPNHSQFLSQGARFGSKLVSGAAPVGLR